MWSYLMSEWFWLPEGVTWEQMAQARQKGNMLPQFSDWTDFVYCSIAFAILRFICEKTVFTWTVRSIMFPRPAKLRASVPHPGLMEAYNRSTKWSEDYIKELSASTGISVAKIKSWYSQIKDADDIKRDPNKWTETCWRCFFYFSLTVYMIFSSYHKDWVWDASQQWQGYPIQDVDPHHRWLYIAETAVYVNLMLSQFFDVRRQDFYAMMVHHLVTIVLLLFSYFANYVRIGVLVLLCHDLVDIFLETAKLFKYAGQQLLADVCFACFSVGWFVFRLTIFPLVVIRSAMFVSLQMVPFFRSWYLFNSLLVVLLLLHVYWFSFIVRVVYLKVVHDQDVDDVREEDDDAQSAKLSESAKNK